MGRWGTNLGTHVAPRNPKLHADPESLAAFWRWRCLAKTWRPNWNHQGHSCACFWAGVGNMSEIRQRHSLFLFLSKFELFGLIFPGTMMINAVMQPLPLRSHEWIRDAAVLEWKRTCCYFTAKESSIGLRHPGPLGREVLQIRCSRVAFGFYQRFTECERMEEKSEPPQVCRLHRGRYQAKSHIVALGYLYAPSKTSGAVWKSYLYVKSWSIKSHRHKRPGSNLKFGWNNWDYVLLRLGIYLFYMYLDIYL